MAIQIKIRRDTKAEWDSADPVLLAGELGFELKDSATSGRFKIGNGSREWSRLPFWYAYQDSAGNYTSAVSAEGNWYGDRGIAAGGYYGSTTGFRSNIDYYDITTPGNATDFGDLTIGKYGLGGISDKTYFLAPGGWEGALSDQTSGHAYTRQIDYITIATAGNASAFGNLSLYNGFSANMCDGSRGVKAGGDYSLGSTNHAYVTNEISYITVTVPSSATDFGDLTTARSGPTGFSDGTYGYAAGGCSASIYSTSPSSIWQNSIDVITIQTTGNATLGGGSLDVAMRHCGGCSNETYAMWGGGRNNSNTNINNIQRMTMSTSASSTDFGDLTSVNTGACCSNNSTRAVWNGQGNPSLTNVLQYVTIDTPGNSADFGDLVVTGGFRFSGSGNAS